jgi:predicted amidohydrolase YtcJ
VSVTSGLLLRDAELDGGRRADIRVRDGIVVQLASALDRRSGEQLIDCGGGAVIAGLCDHHLHLHAMAAARVSVCCGPPQVRDAAGLAAAVRAARPDQAGWIRGVGYFESVAGDLDANALDRMRADVPVRIQHRSGALWILNTAALAAAGLAEGGGRGSFRDDNGIEPGPSGIVRDGNGIERDASGRPTGRLWRADDWLRGRLPKRQLPALAGVGAEICGYGITAVTDATPDLEDAAITAISDAMLRRELPPRVHLLGVPLGGTIPGTPGLTVGPYKIVLADSGMLTYPELTDLVVAAHRAGRPVAIHCVTREALVLTALVLGEVETIAGDRIEHAGVVSQEMLDGLAALRVRVVTQPGFLAVRGDDYLRDTPAAEHEDLYRCGSLMRAGVPVALSSDAPYGPADPWSVMAAAVSRRTQAGRVAGAGERISFRQALGAYLGAPSDPGGPARQVGVWAPADLVVLRVPLAEVHRSPAPVHAVVAGGEIRALPP